MIIIMAHGATAAQIANVSARVEQMGCQVHLSEGQERTIIGVIGNGRPIDREQIERMSGVERTVPVLRPFKLASRDFHPQDTVFPINGVSIGGNQSGRDGWSLYGRGGAEQLMETAQAVKAAGAHALRGGAFKPRTSPYSFPGDGRGGAETVGRGARDHRAACRDGGDVARPSPACVDVC